ncbi:unnamed protein product, partial [Prorocentrum cordatum]
PVLVHAQAAGSPLPQSIVLPAWMSRRTFVPVGLGQMKRCISLAFLSFLSVRLVCPFAFGLVPSARLSDVRGGCASRSSFEQWLEGMRESFAKVAGWEAPLSPAQDNLPCSTDVGLGLLRQMEESDDDSFMVALQSTLLSLRSTPEAPVIAALDDTALLKQRIEGVVRKERQQQILADLLHIGTVYRLRSEGLVLASGPVGQEPGIDQAAFHNSLQILPAAVAMEVRGYVLATVPALGAATRLQVTRANLAPLLMGAGLYGYFLAGAAQSSSDAEVARLAQSDWDSPAAFAVMSARVGSLLELPAESEDPLQRYASLSAVTTEVQSLPGGEAGLPTSDLGRLEGGCLQLCAEGLRRLMGELCAFGFTMRLWEQKITKFTSPG